MKKNVAIKITSALLLALFAASASAQVDVGSIPDQYRNVANSAWGIIQPFAENLFWILATIQLAWAGVTLALEKADLQGWVAGLIRHIMFIGLGYAILLNGKTWMLAIFNSFGQLGVAVIGTPVEPGDIFGRGVDIAWEISNKSVGWDIPLGLAYLLCGIVIMVSFTVIAVSLILALVEGAIAIVLGQILLGFGGSKWTVGYMEKYIGLVVNVGLKVFVTYFMAYIAFTISNNWLAIASASSEVDKIYELVGGAIILTIVTWTLPRFISMVIGGAPSLGFQDAMGSTAGLAAGMGGAIGASMSGAYRAGGALGGLGGAANSVAASAAATGGNQGDGPRVSPPTNLGGGGDGGGGGSSPTGGGSSPGSMAGPTVPPSTGNANAAASAGVSTPPTQTGGAGATGSQPPKPGVIPRDGVSMAAQTVASSGGLGGALMASRALAGGAPQSPSGTGTPSLPGQSATAQASQVSSTGPGPSSVGNEPPIKASPAGSDGGFDGAGAGITNAAPMTSASGDSPGQTMTPGPGGTNPLPSGSSRVSPPPSAAGNDGGFASAGAGITNAAPMTSASGDSPGQTMTPGASVSVPPPKISDAGGSPNTP